MRQGDSKEYEFAVTSSPPPQCRSELYMRVVIGRLRCHLAWGHEGYHYDKWEQLHWHHEDD